MRDTRDARAGRGDAREWRDERDERDPKRDGRERREARDERGDDSRELKREPREGREANSAHGAAKWDWERPRDRTKRPTSEERRPAASPELSPARGGGAQPHLKATPGRAGEAADRRALRPALPAPTPQRWLGDRNWEVVTEDRRAPERLAAAEQFDGWEAELLGAAPAAVAVCDV